MLIRKMDLMESMYTESTKSLNAVVLKHNELLLAHTSDIKRLNEKITAKCKEFHEDFKQKCIQLEAENKFLQQREDGLKKAEDELKNRERKIVKEKSELNNRVRELLSSCKQLDNECFPSRKEDRDRKVYSRRKKAQSTGLCSCPDPKDPATQFGYLMGNPRDPYAPKKNLQIGRELYVLHKRTMELDDQVKIQNGSLQIALQVKEAEGNDLEEKFKNLQSELEEKREPFQELKNSDKDSTLAFNVKDDDLQDARLELSGQRMI